MLYLDPKAKFPQTQEKPGYFVGFAHNVGDHLTFKILKEDMRTVLHRSVVRSANDPGPRNKRVHFKSDMEQVITEMDSRTPRTHKPRRKEDMEVDVEEAEDNISSRTRSQDNLVTLLQELDLKLLLTTLALRLTSLSTSLKWYLDILVGQLQHLLCFRCSTI